MNTRIRLAVVASVLAALAGIATPASAHIDPPGPPSSCPSQDTMVARLQAAGFEAQAANTFATLIRLEGCCAAT